MKWKSSWETALQGESAVTGSAFTARPSEVLHRVSGLKPGAASRPGRKLLPLKRRGYKELFPYPAASGLLFGSQIGW